MQDLRDQLNRLCDDQPFRTHCYVKDLESGQTFGRNDEEVVKSGSTRKVSIMMAALKQVHDGKLSLDDPFTLDAKYQQIASRTSVPGEQPFNTSGGIFQNFTPGAVIPFRDAINMMITVSDNTCAGKIVDIVGLDNINALCQSIGMVGTTHRLNITPDTSPRGPEQANATTARDVGVLLDHIVSGTQDAEVAARLGCTPELCRLALNMLSWQKLRTLLPAMLPKRANVAHKSGTPPDGDSFNDVGIVFDGTTPRFIITYYSSGVPREMPDGMPGSWAANTHAARLCRTCWDHLVPA